MDVLFTIYLLFMDVLFNFNTHFSIAVLLAALARTTTTQTTRHVAHNLTRRAFKCDFRCGVGLGERDKEKTERTLSRKSVFRLINLF